MSAAGPPRRIMVALDGRPESLRALERSTALAAEAGAEIAGLFVEDERLMRLCGLPVIEVRLRGGGARPPEAAVLRREIRARASEARRALERAALRRRLTWTFRIARGRVEEEMLRVEPGTDVVAPGHAVSRAGAPARPLVGAVIAASGDNGPLELASRLARAGESPVLALAPESMLDDPERLRARIESVIGPAAPATVAGYAKGEDGLARRVEGLALEVLVVGASSLTPAALGRLSSAAGCDIVILGDHPPRP